MDNIHTFIEHTNLKATATQEDISTLVEEAKNHSFVGVCVPPYWVKSAKRAIEGKAIKLVTVIGFPLGYQLTEVKKQETALAIQHGADEIDMVINVSAFKSGATQWVKAEISALGQLCHKHGKVLKVILETAYLTDTEIIEACKISVDAGADFVKTSTGFAPEGAKIADIKLMKATVGDNVGIKASGGIRDLTFTKQLIDAGADRIGTSSGPAIIKALK